ncbi:ATP-binding domain-containing protein [Gluconobacter kondonii]|uniref:ATP-binding domain-containing protein n=1 Tax=Gluconobacter kondonii TaxID=941463 RepID=UPI00197FBB64|nr:ATP-binding domain-containing protein [Gluconobacter kondonii]MBN3868031.1 ATP-binding domain-containing protein [Gluconobacter kondonii]
MTRLPFALTDALNEVIEEQNLHAVACVDGKIIGRDDEIRVFNVRHIKGLEFEAVFFVGIDKLAESEPTLFERYLYVGATRAATYLGLCAIGDKPSSIDRLSGHFAEQW